MAAMIIALALEKDYDLKTSKKVTVLKKIVKKENKTE